MKPCVLPAGAQRWRRARGERGSPAMRAPGCTALWVLLRGGVQVSRRLGAQGPPRLPSRSPRLTEVSPLFSSRHLRAPWDPQQPRPGARASSVLLVPRSGRAGWKRAVSPRGGSNPCRVAARKSPHASLQGAATVHNNRNSGEMLLCFFTTERASTCESTFTSVYLVSL